jgi:hypothetical protein
MAATAHAAPSPNGQLWLQFDLTAPLTRNIDLTATVVERQGDGLPNPVLWGGGVTAEFRLSRHWSIGGGAYQVQARSATSGQRRDLTLPLVYATGSWIVAGLTLSDRNRLEQVLGAQGNPWRYRNRLMLRRTLSGARVVRSIFLSDELFYDFDRHHITRNRAQIGLDVAALGPARPQVYLMRQDDASGQPRPLYVLGLGLKVSVE